MLHVRVMQGHQQVFSGTAAQVILPGEAGEVAVLGFHAPMLCALAEGVVQVDERRFQVGGGIAQVARDRVTVLAPGER